MKPKATKCCGRDEIIPEKMDNDGGKISNYVLIPTVNAELLKGSSKGKATERT